MSKKMKAQHALITEHFSKLDGVHYLRLTDATLVAKMTDDQILSFCGHHLSKQTGLPVRGLAVAPGFHLTAKSMMYFNFNFFNTDDSISAVELRGKLRSKLEPHQAGHYPELFRFGVGKADFFWVVGEVDRSTQIVRFSYVGHVDRPATFFRRIRVSREMAPGQLTNVRQSTHYIDPEYKKQYVSELA